MTRRPAEATPRRGERAPPSGGGGCAREREPKKRCARFLKSERASPASCVADRPTNRPTTRNHFAFLPPSGDWSDPASSRFPDSTFSSSPPSTEPRFSFLNAGVARAPETMRGPRARAALLVLLLVMTACAVAVAQSAFLWARGGRGVCSLPLPSKRSSLSRSRLARPPPVDRASDPSARAPFRALGDHARQSNGRLRAFEGLQRRAARASVTLARASPPLLRELTRVPHATRHRHRHPPPPQNSTKKTNRRPAGQGPAMEATTEAEAATAA